MNFLTEILEVKKEEVKRLRSYRTLSSFNEEKYFSAASLGFKNAVRNDKALGVIAEIKKASPSKGILIENFNHMKIAETYMECNIDAISILTDRNFFRGNISYLYDIASIKSVPLLRKDFIIDEFQVFEAKANGADAILLIAEALSVLQINELTSAANECKLDVLLELHSADQLSKINFASNDIIGVNNRNLETFEVSLDTTIELREKIPSHVTLVSESGIKTGNDLDILKSLPVNAVLVGEHFMKTENLKEKIKEFRDWCLI